MFEPARSFHRPSLKAFMAALEAAYIASRGGGVAPALGDELLGQRLAPRDADDHGAALGEGAGGDVPDAGGSAGHDDDLAAIVGGHGGLSKHPGGTPSSRDAQSLAQRPLDDLPARRAREVRHHLEALG